MTTIGLISDTHTPMRWRDVPDAVYDIFDGVDLILHAGDVGELWVLDKLGTIAPVVAVHGNDDSVESIRELPYKQVITVNGTRILLWHSHIQDRPSELAFRSINDWHPKLTRLARSAKNAGASVVVYGHTHIAMQIEWDGVLIVNPGAIASGNMFTQQINQSVALMTINGESVDVEHVNLADPASVWDAPFDPDAGFEAAFKIAERTIVSAELQPLIQKARRTNLRDVHSFIAMLYPLSFAVWNGEVNEITRDQLINALQNTDDLHPEDHATMRDLLGI